MKTKFTFLCCLAMVWCASLAAQTEFSKTGTRWYVPYEHDNIFAHKGYHTRMDLYRLGRTRCWRVKVGRSCIIMRSSKGLFAKLGKKCGIGRCLMVWGEPYPVCFMTSLCR